MSDSNTLELAGKPYEKVTFLNGAQFNIATKLLSTIDLKPIFLVIASTFDQGDTSVTQQIFKNGFLNQAITDLLAKNGENNLVTEIASLVIMPKGKAYDFDDIDSYNEARKEYMNDLLKSDHEITIDLVTFFLGLNTITKMIIGSFSMVGEEEELPST